MLDLHHCGAFLYLLLSCYCDQVPEKKQLKGGDITLAHGFRKTAHHDREGVAVNKSMVWEFVAEFVSHVGCSESR